MAMDSRGVEYDLFFPSVEAPDGAVFQVIVVPEAQDGEEAPTPYCDMEQSATLANAYWENNKPK